MSRTGGRGRALARWLANAAGFVHVDVSEHHPLGDDPESARVLFILDTPLGSFRVVPRNRLYTQRLWLRGKTGRVAIEGLPRGAVDEAMVMVSARTLAQLAGGWSNDHGDGIEEWVARHEGSET